MGVNASPGWGDTVEGRDVPRMERLLADLRPHSVRIPWVDPSRDAGRTRETIRFANAQGIDVLVIDNTAYPPEQVVDGIARAARDGLIVGAVEGQNEPDVPATGYTSTQVPIPASRLAAVADRQQRLHAAVAGRWPVLTPASVYRVNDPALAGLPGEIVSAHRYPDLYGAPPSAALATLPQVGKPVWVTETGIPTRKVRYGFLNLLTKYQVTEAQQALWLPQFRDMLLAAGAQRVFVYRLLNSGPDAFNSQQNFGVYRYDGSAKPVVAALR